jgi:threonine/homoserine/homoserine lactone efflux protein
MKPQMRARTVEWPKALVFLVLLLLSVSMEPHAPLVVTLILGVLLLVSSFWAASSAFRQRRREATTRSDIGRYYLRVIATALVIALGWFLVSCIVAELFG